MASSDEYKIHLDSQGEPGEDGHADSNIGSLVSERVVGSIASTIDFANAEDNEEDNDKYQEGRGRGAEMQELTKAPDRQMGRGRSPAGAVDEGDAGEVGFKWRRDGSESRSSERRVSSNRGSGSGTATSAVCR